MKVPAPRKLKSGTWYIYLRLGGEGISVSASSEKECIRQAQLVKAEYLSGKRDVKDKKKEPEKLPTLKAATDRYIESRRNVLSPATIRGYQIIKRNRFQSTMNRSLSDIDDSEWQTICNDEAKLCQAKTLKNAWGFISSVIAETTGEAPPKVKLPQVILNDRPFLEPEQIRTFIDAVHGTSIEIPALLALSSLRRSEIMALKWENIDLKNGVIKVRGAAVPNEDHKLTYKRENKNASSARDVPIMISELLSALENEKKNSGLVLTGSPNTILKRINKVCSENGLPKIGIHGLRHSFVSLAYHLAVPEKIVMEIGGWSDYQTMRKIYTHIAKSDVSRYADRFSDFFSEKNAN